MRRLVVLSVLAACGSSDDAAEPALDAGADDAGPDATATAASFTEDFGAGSAATWPSSRRRSKVLALT